MSFIEIKNLKKIYNANKSIEVEALKSINLIIEKGDFCSIVGVSGSGKSTLLYILGCIDKQTEGTYLLEGKNVSMMSENELAQIRNKKIGFSGKILIQYSVSWEEAQREVSSDTKRNFCLTNGNCGFILRPIRKT